MFMKECREVIWGESRRRREFFNREGKIGPLPHQFEDDVNQQRSRAGITCRGVTRPLHPSSILKQPSQLPPGVGSRKLFVDSRDQPRVLLHHLDGMAHRLHGGPKQPTLLFVWFWQIPERLAEQCYVDTQFFSPLADLAPCLRRRKRAGA